MYGSKGTQARPSCGDPGQSFEMSSENKGCLGAYSDRTVRPYRRIFDIFQSSAGVSYHRVDREGWETHTGDTLEGSSLRHHTPVVLNCRDMARLEPTRACASLIPCCVGRSRRSDSGDAGMENSLVAQVGLVALMGNITNEVSPRDPIGTFDKPRMCYRAKRLPNVGSVSDVTVSTK